MNQLSNENNADVILLQAFENEAVYSKRKRLWIDCQDFRRIKILPPFCDVLDKIHC